MGFEIPFNNIDEVIACLPEVYVKNLKWFTSTPKFTTVRVNTLKYKPEQILEIIKNNLTVESSKLGITKQPTVFIHNIIRDCIVIGPWEHTGNLNNINNGEVIIDVPCGNAVLRGANIFAPGVLSLSNNACVGDIVEIYVDIKGKCRRGFIKKFTGDKLFIGNGIVKINRTTLFANNAKINGIAIEVNYRISNVPSIIVEPEKGLLQNLPSIICSYVLEPNCNTDILDMCASPGNKTTHIATLIENTGRVIALDKSDQKIAKITALSSYFGLTNIYSFVWDSTRAVLNSDNGEIRIVTDGPPFNRATFSRILLDAPCSALGHRPNIYNKITLKQLKSYSCLQKKLFHNAVELLKPGGILVYSTCTITIEENEDLVKWALNKYNNLKLVKAKPYFGSPGLVESGLSETDRSYVQRFNMTSGDLPESDTIGFFIAKFIKDIF